jgi:hypothetical protein
VCQLNESKYFSEAHAKDVHFLNTNRLETQNVYEPYLDDRLHFYPISSNLITTHNKGSCPSDSRKLQYDHSSFLFVTRCSAQLVLSTHSSPTHTCSILVARIRRDVIHIRLEKLEHVQVCSATNLF